MSAAAISDRDDAYGRSRRLLTIEEVAARLGATAEGVERMVADRRIPFSTPNRSLRFDSAAVELWLESHTDEGLKGES